jgi:hypothetical protein
MELDSSNLILGAHTVVAGFFFFLAVQGFQEGAALAAVGLRVLLAALVVGLGVSVSRLV